MATKAQRFLRRFIDQIQSVLPELFDDFILSPTMLMYLCMHREKPLIDAFPRGRFNQHVQQWLLTDIHQQRS